MNIREEQRMTEISGLSYSIDIAVFTELINKRKEPGFMFDYEEFGLGNTQFEVRIENTRCYCKVNILGPNQETI